METAPWVWVVVGVIVVVLVVLLLLAGGRRRKAVQQKRDDEQRAKAAEIRREAEMKDLDAREREAKATRARADAEQAQVDAARLRQQADQQAMEAKALRDDVNERARKADELDPDVDGDRRGDVHPDRRDRSNRERASHEAVGGGPAEAGRGTVGRDDARDGGGVAQAGDRGIAGHDGARRDAAHDGVRGDAAHDGVRGDAAHDGVRDDAARRDRQARGDLADEGVNPAEGSRRERKDPHSGLSSTGGAGFLGLSTGEGVTPSPVPMPWSTALTASVDGIAGSQQRIRRARPVSMMGAPAAMSTHPESVGCSRSRHVSPTIQ